MPRRAPLLNKTWAQPLTVALHAPSLSGAQYSEGAVSLPWPRLGNLAAVIGSARLIGGLPCSGMCPASFLRLNSMISPMSRLRGATVRHHPRTHQFLPAEICTAAWEGATPPYSLAM